MSTKTIVVEYDEESTFARVLDSVQKQLGHDGNPMQAMIDATTLFAIQKGLPPFKNK
jgi:hypothetical protein